MHLNGWHIRGCLEGDPQTATAALGLGMTLAAALSFIEVPPRGERRAGANEPWCSELLPFAHGTTAARRLARLGAMSFMEEIGAI